MRDDGYNSAWNFCLESLIEPLKVRIPPSNAVALFCRNQIRREARHRVGMLDARVCYSNYHHGEGMGLCFFALGYLREEPFVDGFQEED